MKEFQNFHRGALIGLLVFTLTQNGWCICYKDGGCAAPPPDQQVPGMMYPMTARPTNGDFASNPSLDDSGLGQGAVNNASPASNNPAPAASAPTAQAASASASPSSTPASNTSNTNPTTASNTTGPAQTSTGPSAADTAAIDQALGNPIIVPDLATFTSDVQPLITQLTSLSSNGSYPDSGMFSQALTVISGALNSAQSANLDSVQLTALYSDVWDLYNDSGAHGYMYIQPSDFQSLANAVGNAVTATVSNLSTDTIALNLAQEVQGADAGSQTGNFSDLTGVANYINNVAQTTVATLKSQGSSAGEQVSTEGNDIYNSDVIAADDGQSHLNGSVYTNSVQNPAPADAAPLTGTALNIYNQGMQALGNVNVVTNAASTGQQLFSQAATAIDSNANNSSSLVGLINNVAQTSGNAATQYLGAVGTAINQATNILNNAEGVAGQLNAAGNTSAAQDAEQVGAINAAATYNVVGQYGGAVQGLQNMGPQMTGAVGQAVSNMTSTAANALTGFANWAFNGAAGATTQTGSDALSVASTLGNAATSTLIIFQGGDIAGAEIGGHKV